jgi:hypothetical protein
MKDKFGNKKKPPGSGGRLGRSELWLLSDLSTAVGAGDIKISKVKKR